MMRSTAMPAILFALLLISCGAQALPGDEQKPIEIEADRAELDDATLAFRTNGRRPLPGRQRSSRWERCVR